MAIEIDGTPVEAQEGYNGVYSCVERTAMGLYADVSHLDPVGAAPRSVNDQELANPAAEAVPAAAEDHADPGHFAAIGQRVKEGQGASIVAVRAHVGVEDDGNLAKL